MLVRIIRNFWIINGESGENPNTDLVDQVMDISEFDYRLTDEMREMVSAGKSLVFCYLGWDGYSNVKTYLEIQKVDEFDQKLFGRWVRRMRELAEFNQKDLGIITGMHQTEVSRIESGKAPKVTYKEVKSICKAFGYLVSQMEEDLNKVRDSF